MEEINLISDYNILILSRIGLSILFGFMLGFEREITGKFAGLRTHILVCTGACVFTILSIYGFKMAETVGFVGTNDPARIAAQIITGIGFIGAGTVMRSGANILGITTAATLWVCAAVGMACGTGEFSLAAIATISTMAILILIRIFEKKVIQQRISHYRNIEIKLSTSIKNADVINTIIEKYFTRITKLDKKVLNGTDLKINLTVLTNCSLYSINEAFAHLECLNSLEVQEVYE